MEQPIEFTLVRHGETVANAAGLAQGQLESDLSERGRAQAQVAAEALRGEHFDACYASDLKRAMDTARIILAAGHPGVEARPEPGLREWSLGVWEGRPCTELHAFFPGFVQTLCDVPGDIRLEGGECRSEFLERIRRTLARLAALHRAGERILIVFHGAAMRMAMACVYGPPAPDGLAPDIDNAGVSVMDYYPEAQKWRLVSWNC